MNKASAELKLTGPQRALMKQIAKYGRLPRPWGYSTAGRDAANWDRMIVVLERAGLVRCSRRLAGGIAYDARPILPMPGEFCEQAVCQ